MPSHDAEKRLHRVRTLLNHVVGYATILKEDASLAELEPVAEALRELHDKALSLRAPLDDYFEDEFILPAHERQSIYSILYDVVALGQTAKRACKEPGSEDIAAGIHRILEAANGLIGIFEERLGAAISPAVSGPRTLSELDILEPADVCGRILVVDDEAQNREILSRHLERQGHAVQSAPDGPSALAAVAEAIEGKAPFDAIILDLMMPGMSGFQVLETIKRDPRARDTPVIIISAVEESGGAARCIRLGAEDYLSRDFDPVILRARLQSCLERRRLLLRQNLYVGALLEAQSRLAAELRDAADYVRSLLPRRTRTEAWSADWVFIPSLSLGGDIFGFHPVDGERMAIFLVDVSGHGIQSALVSVTVMNMLRSGSLSRTDFADPAATLDALNRSFRSEDQNGLFFSAWYGAYEPRTRELVYASAGSPPAILIGPDGSLDELETGGSVIGIDQRSTWVNEVRTIQADSRLYLFSDGIFEARKQGDGILGWDEFLRILASVDPNEGRKPGERAPLGRIVDAVRGITGSDSFDDDVSMLEFRFHP